MSICQGLRHWEGKLQNAHKFGNPLWHTSPGERTGLILGATSYERLNQTWDQMPMEGQGASEPLAKGRPPGCSCPVREQLAAPAPGPPSQSPGRGVTGLGGATVERCAFSWQAEQRHNTYCERVIVPEERRWEWTGCEPRWHKGA